MSLENPDWDFPASTSCKESVYQYGRWGDGRDVCLIPGWGRSPRIGNGNPLQYSCLENPMDRGTWQATVHGVRKSWPQLSIHRHTHTKNSDCSIYLLQAYLSLVTKTTFWLLSTSVVLLYIPLQKCYSLSWSCTLFDLGSVVHETFCLYLLYNVKF